MPKPAEKPKSQITGPDLLILGVLAASVIPIIGGFLLYLFAPLDFLYEARAFFAPFFEKYLIWLQLISLLISALLVWGLIYIITKTNYFEMKREHFLDIMGEDLVSKRRKLKAWEQIKKRLLSENQNDWKLAILEADMIMNEILKMSGYLGNKLEEKLEIITPAQLSNVDEIKNAHKIGDKIAADPSFEITQKEAREIIDIYKKSFIEFGLLSED